MRIKQNKHIVRVQLTAYFFFFFLVCYSRGVLFFHQLKNSKKGKCLIAMWKCIILASNSAENGLETADRGVRFIRTSQLMPSTLPVSIVLKVPMSSFSIRYWASISFHGQWNNWIIYEREQLSLLCSLCCNMYFSPYVRMDGFNFEKNKKLLLLRVG